MFGLYLVVFINFIGLGALIPILPFAVTEFAGAPEYLLTFLLAEFAFAGFVFSPFWGRLSDLFGGKIILIITLVLASISHLCFALTNDLTVMFISRAFAGAASGNIGVIQAAIASKTSSSERSKYMGYLGAFMGLGFIAGPIVGAFFSSLFKEVHKGPFIVASLFAIFSMIIVIFFTKIPKEKKQTASLKYFKTLKTVFSSVLIYFALCWAGISFAFAQVEAIFILTLRDILNFNSFKSGLFFSYVGFLIVLTQAFLVGYLTKIIGEIKVIYLGLFFLMLGQFLIAIFVYNYIDLKGLSFLLILVLISTVFICVGFGLTSPSFTSATSKICKQRDIGISMGTFQGFGSLGQVLGLVIAGPLYTFGGSELSFIFGGSIILFIIIIGIPKVNYYYIKRVKTDN